MAIQWLSSPERRTVMTPGKPWEYCLPLVCAGDIPQIDWCCDLVSAGDIRVDANDPRNVAITIPTHLEACFGEVSYCVHDPDQVYRGRILVLVQRQTTPSERDSAKSPTSGADATQTPGPNGTAMEPVVIPIPADVPLAQPPGAGLFPTGPTATHSPAATQQQEHENNIPSADNQATPPPLSGPVLTGEYVVEVFRRGVRVAQLVAPVHPGRTTTIGRRSRSHGIPDLDLRGQFETAEAEEACSRRQAEVFWSEERVVIKTVGRNLLRLLGDENRPDAELPSLHRWQPGQTLVLPGGLHLVLKKQRP
jgi:hypothetical protein